ncbi:Sus1p [Lachancea thermotolerans CBS 6340]|uniref:Transcription and mRNA export factor SUS1 n=1 Tax=Lachancea thermotolerans (strain ATCC 56472 / CBS 6340 / NRRL Y-8284) TaxID=559295 RepID=C5DL69_LACTC|nr:KLTH0F10450p [Lachancea thermotolerans CBS 6340]CAR24220.1 KLTH0F10450p [Lachancea thermotolerans CBS 6340]
MTANGAKTMELKAQIQQYLVESGNYELISNKLSRKLLEEGWTDQVKRMTSEEIRADDSASFTQILSKVEPKALGMVSDSTKDEILSQIRNFLSEIVETE